MTRGKRYTDTFKQEAVSQVIKHGYKVSEVAANLGVSTKSLYDWIRQEKRPKEYQQENDLQAENARLKKALHRAQQERDILKEATAFFAAESSNATRS